MDILAPHPEPMDADDAALTEEVQRLRSCITKLNNVISIPNEHPAHETYVDDMRAAHAASEEDIDPSEWQVPPHCIPIHANVTTYDWRPLIKHSQFDVVLMDPPWQLATANPTRGVSLGYSQLQDHDISSLPVPQLQKEGGFLFIWTINAKYKWTLDLFEKWGYRMVDEIVWVKMTVNRRMAKSHGYYLQHAKEVGQCMTDRSNSCTNIELWLFFQVCLVGKKGRDPPGMRQGGVGSDVILADRRGQSQKPEELYELIEALVPHGRYIEIFAR